MSKVPKLRILATLFMLVSLLALGVPMAMAPSASANTDWPCAYTGLAFVDDADVNDGTPVRVLEDGTPLKETTTGLWGLADNEYYLDSVMAAPGTEVSFEIFWDAEWLAADETAIHVMYGRVEVDLHAWTGPPPPECDDWFPAHGATDVPRDVVVGVHFTKDMNPATIDETTFLLDGVAGVADYNVATRWASFTPGAPLASLTEYTATVTTGAQDTDGLSLEEPCVWSFTTIEVADWTDPEVLITFVEYPYGVYWAQPCDPIVVLAIVTDPPDAGEVSGIERVEVDASAIDGGIVELCYLWSPEEGIEVWGPCEEDGLIHAGEVQPDSYQLVVTAYDEAGNSSTPETQEVVISYEHTAYNIWLCPCWNLLSLPLIPDDSDIGVVLDVEDDYAWGVDVFARDFFEYCVTKDWMTQAELDDMVPEVEVVWGYDPTAYIYYRWLYYYPGELYPTLTTMEDGPGYWLKADYEVPEWMDDGCMGILTIYGVEMPTPPDLPPSYDVVAGWNLVGFKSVKPMCIWDYLIAIWGTGCEDWAVIWGYWCDWGWYNVWPLGQAWYECPECFCWKNICGRMFCLQPGEGYWLYMAEDGTIVPPSGH